MITTEKCSTSESKEAIKCGESKEMMGHSMHVVELGQWLQKAKE